ncbi:hypothetical protein SAMN04487934_103126 [Eubacterium ruminantium]|nr:hypothetical protein SAMN04487934_103126 [Eubacterium ruminantium]
MRRWMYSRDSLMKAIRMLGFPDELGEAVVKNLGSPKAMDRMTAYLMNVKPQTAELVVDEMLAICTEIEAWRAKKESEAANAEYNEMLYFGLDNSEEDF